MCPNDSTPTTPRRPTRRICGQVKQSLTPLRRLSRLFSLDYAADEHQTRCQTVCSVIKAIITAGILGFLNFYTLYLKIRDHYDRINISIIKLTDAIQMCYDYFQYLVDLFFVFKYGRNMYKEFCSRYANIDSILGITDYSLIRSKIIKLIIYFIIIWLVSSVVDFTGWALSNGFFLPTLYSTRYIYLFIKMLNILDISSHVMHIEYRLKFMKDQLTECHHSANTLQSDLYDPITVRSRNWWISERLRVSPSKSKITSEGVTFGRKKNEIRWISRCYLILLEQSVFINKMYGIRILLNSLSLMIDMIRFTNVAVRLIIGSQVTLYNSGLAAANLLRTGTCALVLATLVAQCERAYGQAAAALAVIDHTLVDKDPDADLRAALIDLRRLIETRRIDFHMAYFFRLDYSLLVSTASVVVTYTIILLQSLPN